jgi:hypothetical protein
LSLLPFDVPCAKKRTLLYTQLSECSDTWVCIKEKKHSGTMACRCRSFLRWLLGALLGFVVAVAVAVGVFHFEFIGPRGNAYNQFVLAMAAFPAMVFLGSGLGVLLLDCV